MKSLFLLWRLAAECACVAG